MSKELSLFGIGILTGLFLCALFDFFRAFRMKIKHKNFWVALEDLSYWMFVGIFLFHLLKVYNRGIVRFYLFLAVGIGVAVYCLLFQKLIFFCFAGLFEGVRHVLSLFGRIKETIRKIVKKMLILPLKKLIKTITIILHNS